MRKKDARDGLLLAIASALETLMYDRKVFDGESRGQTLREASQDLKEATGDSDEDSD